MMLWEAFPSRGAIQHLSAARDSLSVLPASPCGIPEWIRPFVFSFPFADTPRPPMRPWGCVGYREDGDTISRNVVQVRFQARRERGPENEKGRPLVLLR